MVIVEILPAEYVEVSIETSIEDEHIERLTCNRIVALGDGSVAALGHKLLVGAQDCRKTCGHDVALVDYAFSLLDDAHRSQCLLICLVEQTA